MANITLRVNGTSRTVDVDPATPLLYVLRNDLDLHGPRFGCGLGQCGACTVLIKGEAVRSCIRPVSTVAGAEITTLEGLARDGKLHPLQQAWIDEQVPACGFCQNGQIMTAKALLDRNPTPTDAQIRQGMNTTLCRCMTYYRIQAAIKRASKAMASAQRREHERGDRMTHPQRLPQDLRRARRRTERRPATSCSTRKARAPVRIRTRLPSARFLDRHPSGQHRDVLRRQDRPRSGHRHRVPPDHGRRARHALRQDELRHGHHRHHRRSGRVWRIGCAADRRLPDAPRRRRSASRAAGHGVGAPRRAGRAARGRDGVVSVAADPSKRVTYGELIGGRKFNVTLTGNNINATTGAAPLKDVNQFKIVGQSPQRYDIPAKVDGSLKWAVDAKVPGMLHARNVRPPVAGRDARQHRRVVRERRARLRQGGEQGQLRRGRVRARGAGDSGRASAQGELAEAGDGAVPVVRRPLRLHAQRDADIEHAAECRGESGRRDDGRGEGRRSRLRGAVPGAHRDRSGARDGRSVERSADDLLQRHEVVRAARRRRRSSCRCRAIACASSGWKVHRPTAAPPPTMPGFEAAFLAKELGRPVRVQWMRNEETAWDTKGPAFVVKARGGLDAQGNLVAFDYDARAADFNHLGYNEPDTVLIAQLMGTQAAPRRIARQRRRAERDVRDPQPPHDDARRGPAAGMGDAAADRESARPEWSAVHVCVGIVHRRTRRGSQGRSGRVPPEAADREKDDDSGFKRARSIAASRPPPRPTSGTRGRRRSASAAARS